MRGVELDEILNRISLRFGVDSIAIIVPDDIEVNFSLYDISKIDISRLDDELINQSKLTMLFQGLLSYSANKHSIYEAALKKVESSASERYETKLRNKDPQFATMHGERITDKKVALIVAGDMEVQEMEAMAYKYKDMVNSFSNILKGLEKRNDALTQLSTKRNKMINSNVAGLL